MSDFTELRKIAGMALTAFLAFTPASVTSATDDVTRFEYRDFQQGHREFDAADYNDAYQYWESLAKEGVPEAQYNIGRMHAYGEGVPKNYAVAYAWFLRAEKNGAPEATDALSQLLDFVSRDEISEAESMARDIARLEAGYTDTDVQPRLFGTNPADDDFVFDQFGGD